VDVAANGDVAYLEYNGYRQNAFRYRAGASELLTPGADAAAAFAPPVTDGINVVFATISFSPATLYRTLLLRPDGVEMELAGPKAQSPAFAAENGWVAYDLYDAAAVAQVWVRAPDGTTRQATRATAPAYRVALGPNGELAYESGGRRHVVVPPYTGAPVDIGAAHMRG